jgi:hypothetical protein
MLAAGTTLGPYKILAPLRAGGMGEVYRAEAGALLEDSRIQDGQPISVKPLG